MKLLFSIASVLALAAAPAFAGEGHVSSKSLQNCGLSGMKVMSDADGMSIRGTAATVFGVAVASSRGELAIAGYNTTERNVSAGLAVAIVPGKVAVAFSISGGH
jgi:hypothetical protein